MTGRIQWLMFSLVFSFAAPALAQTTVCVPQFLNGSLGAYQWRTTLILQNQEQIQAQIQLHFRDSNGAPIQQLRMTRAYGQGPQYGVGLNGEWSPDPIRARSMIALRSTGEGGLQAGYVMVQSQQRIQVQARLQVFDANGTLVSETGAIPGPQFRQGTFYAGRSQGALIGLALINPSTDRTVACTVEVVSEEGEVLGTTIVALGAHAQIASYLFELFPQLLTDEGTFVRITCVDPVCALVLHLNGLEMFQIPVVVVDPN